MKNVFLKCFGLCAILCVVLLFTCNVHGQGTTASIVGQVTDPTGAVIPGAAVTATEINKGIEFTGQTNAIGDYVVLNVTPGTYKITASAPGFDTGEARNAILVIDQKLLQNFSLKPGKASTTVVVTQAPTTLQTQSSETGVVMQAQAIVDLPLLSRNFYDLTLLVPGVVLGSGNTNSYNLSVGGNREYGNSIQIDGVESTTNRTQDVTVGPSVDSVEEFKVSTSAYNAEFGSSAGGVVSIETKAGTNTLHGDAFEFFRPNFTTARPYGFGGLKEPGSILKEHIYGGTLGGPIKRGKAFFFGSFEGTTQHNAYTSLDQAPPMSQIKFLSDGSADLSGMIDPNTGTQIPIFDPNVSYACYGGCKQQFAGDIIPANRVSTAGKNTLLNFFPKPNLTGTGNGWFQNFAGFSPDSFTEQKYDGRFDDNLGANDRLYVTYHYDVSNILDEAPFYGHTVVPNGGDNDFGNKQDTEATALSGTYVHVFSPTTLNEFRFGWSRYVQHQFSLMDGIDYSTKYGMGNIHVPGFPATDGYPYMYLASGYFTGGSTYKPYNVLDNNFQFTDNFSWSSIARHEFKFGEEYRRLSSRPEFSLLPTGYQYFSSYGYSQTADPTYSTIIPGAYFWAGGSDIADLLLGLPLATDIGLQLTHPHTQSWYLGLYAQDTFRATPRLTLNYGVRYEFYAPYVEAHNYESNFDLASGDILLAGLGGNSRALIDSRKNDFAPRVGLAYMLNDKTVLRAGWGLFYSPENDGREDFLTKNAPFADQFKYTNYVYNGPGYQYVDDTGVPRNTTINAPSSGRIDPTTLPNGNLIKTYSVDPHLKTGVSQLFNAAIERQLNPSLALDLAYVGSLAHALSYEIADINVNPNDGTNNYDNRITPNLGGISYLSDYGASSYNSLQVKLTKQESRNLSFLLSYTWGHNRDNGPSPFNVGVNNDQPQNPYNLHPEWASSDADVRNVFVFSGLYRLPIGKGQMFFSDWGRLTNTLLGGWQINAIYTMQSGTPVNVIRGNNPTGVLPGLRPDLKGIPTLPRGKRTLAHWFNTAAFDSSRFNCDPTLPTCQQLAPGTAGRNIVVGPGLINLDSSLFKEFAPSDRYRLQLRFEAFNALNTPHFSGPDGNQNDGTFGAIQYQINSQEANRKIQIAAKFIF